jgi:hypothetical protein
MKTSDGETTYTGKKNRTSKIEQLQLESSLSCRNKPNRNKSSERTKQSKYNGESPYVMVKEKETNNNKDMPKNKKDLSFSEAIRPWGYPET